MAWLSGYGKRKSVTITGQSGAGTNCQVNFSIGEDSGGDFSVPNSLAFPNDLRFTDNDQTTELDYWIEDLTVDPISVWVEVADDLGSNVIIYSYYGKSGDTTTSSITNTFLFGDDFEYDDTPANHGWTITYGTFGTNIATSTDYAKTGTRSLKLYPASGVRTYLKNTFTGTNEIAVECYYYETNNTETSIFTGIFMAKVANTTWDCSPWCYDNANYKGVCGGGEYISSKARANGWHRYKITHDGSNVKSYVDGIELTEAAYANSDNIIEAGLWSGSTVGGWDSIRYYDLFFMRKYIVTEPAFSSAGEEESVPASSKAYSWGTIF